MMRLASQLKRHAIVLLLLLLTSGVWAEFVLVSETSDRRAKISLSIFPRIVAVDNHFRKKLTSRHKARMVFVYDQDRQKAQQLKSEFLVKSQSVAGMELEVIVMSVEELYENGVDEPTAFFITERMSKVNMYNLIKKAVETGRILFSPFSGDVEKGATAGIAVTSRVKPYFNINTLKKSGIEINALLMKLSKQYE